jgi:rhodanese-related sulfurtransferase
VDFIVQNWFLVVVAVTSGGMLLWPLIKGGMAGVSAAEAVRLMNREKAVVLDVSEPDEFSKGHISGAKSLPLAQVQAAAKGLPSNKALPLVVVCPTGARATRAVLLLRKMGYERALPLAGGLAAWREANLPVQRSAA